MSLQFDNKISTGHLLTASAMMIAGVMAYADVRSSQEFLRGEMVSVKADAAARESRIRALELGAGRTDEKLTNILSVLGRIERRLDNEAAP
jgi:hypothetical protein